MSMSFPHLNYIEFAKFVKILTDQTYDSNEICNKLAQIYPHIFLELAESSVPSKKNDSMNAVIQLIIENSKIEAIKIIRSELGVVGLKEAKDIADNIQSELFMRHAISNDYNGELALLNRDTAGIFKEFLKIICARYPGYDEN